MSTNKHIQEQISAMVDGELSDAQVEQLMALLRTPQGRAAWEDFHRIGDILRTGDMAFAMSDDFGARMSARLEAEPIIVAPAAIRPAQVQRHAESDSPVAGRKYLRFAIPGAAVAAIATAVIVATPNLMVAHKDMQGGRATPAALAASAPAIEAAGAPNAQDGVVLRDPRIDEYLLAHQRFSPAVFSNAQYARSASFANDSGK